MTCKEIKRSFNKRFVILTCTKVRKVCTLVNCSDIVLDAVRQNGRALEFASSELKRDKSTFSKPCGKMRVH